MMVTGSKKVVNQTIGNDNASKANRPVDTQGREPLIRIVQGVIVERQRHRL